MNQNNKSPLSHALQLLAKRELSEKMLAQLLEKKGYNPEDIDTTINFCKEKKYCDDRRFTASFIRTQVKRSPVGPKYIIQKIQFKGISSDLFWDVWKELDIQEEECISKAYQKKVRENTSINSKEKMKIIQFLLSKGFSYEKIQAVIR